MDVEEIDRIVVNTAQIKLGSFLYAQTHAWMYADPSNKQLLKPIMEALIEKYPDVFKR